MSICVKCSMVMSEKDYAFEGMCHQCYYDDVLEKEAELSGSDIIDDNEPLSEELEPYIDEIMALLYSEDRYD